MERLLALWLPELERESDDGSVVRRHLELLEALVLFCPFAEAVRFGLFVLPIRAPSRFVGGEDVVLNSVRAIVERDGAGEVSLGVADGLFAATAAARRGIVLAPGETARFCAALPIEECGVADFAVTARRLGLYTVGALAALPRARVTERFNAAVVRAHELATGERDAWEEYRDPVLFRRFREVRGDEEIVLGQIGFFGDRTDADRRAVAVAHRVATRLGVEGVWTASLQGGRTPLDQVAWRPWGAPAAPEARDPDPWPGRLPSPAPSVVLRSPVRLDVLDHEGHEVRVTGRATLSSEIATLRFRHGGTYEVRFSAGPWPHDEGWWSARRRRAHAQVLLEDGRAFWVYAERGAWWLAGVYD